jgi:hypothetical protein
MYYMTRVLNRNKNKLILNSSPTACLCSYVTVHFNLSGQTHPMHLIHEIAAGMAAGTGSGGVTPEKNVEIAVARR